MDLNFTLEWFNFKVSPQHSKIHQFLFHLAESGLESGLVEYEVHKLEATQNSFQKSAKTFGTRRFPGHRVQRHLTK